MKTRATAAAALTSVIVLAGCASRSHEPAAPPRVPAPRAVDPARATTLTTTTSTTTTDVDVAATRPASRPFLIREAKLPEGYPPPGPVGVVMVKRYPPSRVAMVTTNADDESRHSPNDMFRPLFNHISKNDIKMTAPVIIDYGEPDQRGANADVAAAAAADAKPVSMAFVYAAVDIGAPGVAGDGVRVRDVPAVTVASVGVRGSFSDARWRQAVAQLEGWLDSGPGRAYSRAGPPRYLAYNSPFVPWFLKYGEVQLPIE